MAESARNSVLRAQELKEFTYAVSHDLKSPTNTLALILDEIALRDSEGSDPEDVHELIDAGRRTTVRMTRLIDDVLGYAATLNTTPDMRLTDLTALAHDVVQDVEAERRKEDGRIEIEPMPMAICCAALMRPFLQNLVANGLKFHAPGIAPRITIGATPCPGEGLVRLWVRDNGIGIPAVHRERVQKIFAQLNSRSAYEGSGVGLALCRRVAECHGTRLEIDDAPAAGLGTGRGTGTEISIRLPTQN